MKTLLDIEPGAWHALRNHLLVRDPLREQAAFMFAKALEHSDELRLVIASVRLVEPHELACHSSCHLELKEETWSAVIREAHQRQAALVEVHSHVGDDSAEFSASDMNGLSSTAPHVAWRLKGRPFAALVVTRKDFDALCWGPGQPDPDVLTALHIGTQALAPTSRSRRRWHEFQTASL